MSLLDVNEGIEDFTHLTKRQAETTTRVQKGTELFK
jgi:hypothetical protein